MTPRFQKKNVFVTGAGSGFGRATALGLAHEGAAEVCLVEVLPDRLEAVGTEVRELGARAHPILADLSDLDVCARAVGTALAECGHLDVVVLNHALMSWETPFLELTVDGWERELRVDLTSFFVMAQRAARSLVETGGGSISFTASVNALGAGGGFAPYCAAKAGLLVSLAQVMAVELAPHGVRVNCVSPGPADTQRSVDLVGEETMERFRESFPGVPLNRLASAEDIAEAFLYLASDAAAYVTGQNLVVDGGLSAQVYHLPD